MIRHTVLSILVILISPLGNDYIIEKIPDSLSSIRSLTGESLINEEGKNIFTRFNPPDGYRREDLDKNTFAYYLRYLPLKEHGAVVKYFNGTEKSELVYDAVINIDPGKKDLQQCADAIMRLRAEYFYSRKEFEKISFTLTNGFRMDYSEWIKGNRLAVNGNKTRWVKSAAHSNTYADFRNYLEIIFTYAGTISLAKSLHPKNIDDIAIGDVFVYGGSPGHAVIVIDVAESKSGDKVFMIAQSYMPAQEMHILKNYNDESISPWYKNSIAELNSPQWYFKVSDLKSFE